MNQAEPGTKSMTRHSPLNEDERTELVAYLDGELDGPQSRAMEARLNVDAGLRAEADELRRAWGLLDYLPRPEPSASFTARTLQRMPQVQTAVLGRRPGRRRRWLLGGAWAAGLLLAAAGGYWSTSHWRQRSSPEQDLVRDLRIIENKRLYEQVDDIDFLKELDHPDLFGDDNQES